MKYVGSKASIVKHIAPIIQSRLTPESTYIEPFVGGANSIIHIQHPVRRGFDANKYVIALLIALRDGWTPPYIGRDEYLDIRDHPEEYALELVGWAGICCSYSGKWFGGYAGKVTTKAGFRDYVDEARRHCLKQAEHLRGIQFSSCDYTDIDPPDGSVIYCDPPYADTLKYPGEFDTGKFWLWCQELSKFHAVLVSEYAAPEGWQEIWSQQRGSSLSANGSIGGRKVITERLFVYRG